MNSVHSRLLYEISHINLPVPWVGFSNCGSLILQLTDDLFIYLEPKKLRHAIRHLYINRKVSKN